MPGRQGCCVLNCILFERFVVSVKPNQAVAGRFIERNSKLQMGRRIDNGFVNILYRFDEVALPDNNISVFRNRQSNRF